MTPKALEWQLKIKKFVNDELIPWEVHAEKNEGELPKEIEKKHREIAISLGLPGMGISKESGGLGLNMFEQMIVWEQLGRVTNALCWCFSEAQDWMENNFTDYQKENYFKPLLNGTKKECYAITEKGAGSDVEGSIETTAETTNTNNSNLSSSHIKNGSYQTEDGIWKNYENDDESYYQYYYQPTTSTNSSGGEVWYPLIDENTKLIYWFYSLFVFENKRNKTIDNFISIFIIFLS